MKRTLLNYAIATISRGIHGIHGFYVELQAYKLRYLDICPKNDVILFSSKVFFCFYGGLGLELAEIRFRSNVHSSK